MTPAAGAQLRFQEAPDDAQQDQGGQGLNPSARDQAHQGAAHPIGTGPAAAARSRTGSELRQRKHVVGVRLDDAERAELETRAGSKSLGGYLREAALATVTPRTQRRPSLDRQLLARTNADLNRIGSNLNQIARALNSGQAAPPDAIAETTEELRSALGLVRRAFGYDRQG